MQLPLFNMIQKQSKILEYKMGLYVCKIFGKSFYGQNSCCDLMAFLQSTSKCTICNCVLSQMHTRGGLCLFKEMI